MLCAMWFHVEWNYIRVVTWTPISRQRPKYEQTTIEKVFDEVFSTCPAPCPVLGNGPIDMHSDNRRSVFCVVRAMPSAG
jgi:hypothetical protein